MPMPSSIRPRGSNHSRNNRDPRRVSFADDEVTEVINLKPLDQYREDLYFQPHEYIKFHNDYQKEVFCKALTSWIPKKTIKKMVSRKSSRKE